MSVVIGAALISGAVSLGMNAWNKGSSAKASRIAAAESANDAMRKRNEAMRQKHEASKLFSKDISTAYGNDFLSNLKGGVGTDTLMENLARGSTSFSKKLQEYEANAKQSIDNSVQGNRDVGIMANMQGQMNALGMSQMGIQSEQAQGQAVSTQTISGIRSDAGTGANAQKMQEQANQMAMDSMVMQLGNENKSTMLQMQSGQLSASQSASSLRREADISAEEAVENALAGYAKYESGQREFDEEAKGHKKDFDYFSEEADNSWLWKGEQDRITEKELTFEDD